MKQRIEKIDDFLKLLSEVSKNGIEVDSKLVYSNLIALNSKRERVRDNFSLWQEKFYDCKNLNVFVAPNWKYFCQFKSIPQNAYVYNCIKLYVPFDKEHISNSVTKLFSFVSDNNITHVSKVASDTRFDDVVLRVKNKEDILKIKDFVVSDKDLTDGLIEPNPFSFQVGPLAVTWDGNLSYNMVVSDWISKYIEDLDRSNSLDNASYFSFYQYVHDKFNEIFINGNGINEFCLNKGFTDVYDGLTNYYDVTSIFLTALNPKSTYLDLFSQVDVAINPEHQMEVSNNLRRLISNDKYDVSDNNKKEVFDYTFYEMSRIEGVKNAISRFRHFTSNGDYRIFTRDKNIRNLIVENGLTPLDIDNLLYEEEKQSLINASLKTLEKYDGIQLSRALILLQNGSYEAFTNDDNVRNNLSLFISKDNASKIIHRILEDSGYSVSSDEEVWLFMEMISKMSLERKCDNGKNRI